MGPTQILASTTDTQEQVQAALDSEPSTAEAAAPASEPVTPETPPPPPPPPAEPGAPPVEPVEEPDEVDDPDEDAKAASDAAAALARQKGKLQKRINDLIKAKTLTKKEVQAKDLRIANLERQLAGLPAVEAALTSETDVDEDDEVAPPAPAPPAPPVQAAPEPDPDETAQPEPNIDDFESVAEHSKAMAKWVLAESKREERLAAKKADVETRHQAAFKVHQERFLASRDEAKTRYPDWAEATEAARSLIVPDMLRIEIQDSEVAGDLLYHFAKNPQDLQDILAVHPNIGFKKLGVIEARIMEQVKAAKAAKEAPAVPAKPATKPIALSNAPEPVVTVGGSTTAGDVEMDTMNYQDYKKVRNAQIAAARR